MTKTKFTLKSDSTFILFVFSAFILLATMFSNEVHAKSTKYISDELNVPVRSGASTQHRIIKFLSSGAAVTVMDMSDDGKFAEIELADEKSAWVLNENLMDAPSARERLVKADSKLTESRQESKDLKIAIDKLKAEISELKKENNALQGERTNLSNSLEDLQITAANPLALSKKNKELKQELEKVNANEAMLEKDNQQLRSNVTQEWFMIGGGVSIGSLILGLILTRINWRKKRSSWGDSF